MSSKIVPCIRSLVLVLGVACVPALADSPNPRRIFASPCNGLFELPIWEREAIAVRYSCVTSEGGIPFPNGYGPERDLGLTPGPHRTGANRSGIVPRFSPSICDDCSVSSARLARIKPAVSNP